MNSLFLNSLRSQLLRAVVGLVMCLWDIPPLKIYTKYAKEPLFWQFICSIYNLPTVNKSFTYTVPLIACDVNLAHKYWSGSVQHCAL